LNFRYDYFEYSEVIFIDLQAKHQSSLGVENDDMMHVVSYII
jgi:hypothetical protein